MTSTDHNVFCFLMIIAACTNCSTFCMVFFFFIFHLKNINYSIYRTTNSLNIRAQKIKLKRNYFTDN